MRYCVLLRASDRRGTKECLQYTLDAINTEEAACEAKKQAAEHYRFQRIPFEVSKSN